MGGGAAAGAGGSDDGAACTPAPSAECTELCPTFDTCYLAAGMGQPDRLYYRAGDQRFDCDGLDCDAAALRKNDYCCQRGEFAPDDDDDGGGCTLPAAVGVSGSSGSSAPWLGVLVGAGALALGRARRRSRLQQRR